MKSPAFQLYVNDFLGSPKVAMMNAAEIGAYTMLLFLDWQECGFVYDEAQLARWCRMNRAQFKKAWVRLKPCFTEIDGRLFNPRLKKEREKQLAWREKAARGGKASGEARRKGSSTTHEVPLNHPSRENEQPLNTPFPSPVTTPPTTARAKLEEKFAEPSQRAILVRFLDSLPDEENESSWIATIDSAWLQGLGMPDNKPALPEDVALGLTEFLMKPRDYAPRLVREFVSSAVVSRLKGAERGSPIGRPTGNGTRPSATEGPISW